MVLATLFLLAVPLGVITVDDNGPADFADLPAAVVAALPGDTILIAPGLYHPTVVTKALSFVGADPGGPLPNVGFGPFSVVGAPSLSIQGLDFSELRISGVTGRVRLDALDYHTAFGPIQITDCPDVEITRSTIRGEGSPAFSGEPGLLVLNSDVTIVDSTLIGGDGEDDVVFPDDGYAAVFGDGATHLTLVGCSAFGGNGGISFLSPSSGAPAIAEVVTSGLTVTVRGSSSDLIQAGSGGGMGVTPKAIDGQLTWSGATILPSSAGAAVSPAEPYLSIGGGFTSGSLRRIEAYGATGESAFVFFSLSPANFSLPGFQGDPLKLGLGGVFATLPMTLLGQDTAATWLFAVPSGLAVVGLQIDVQALVQASSGPFITNAHQLILLD